MKRPVDLRGYKKALRARYRAIRKGMDPGEKRERDGKILRHLLAMPAYRECSLLLTYVSTAEEIDTRTLIGAALSQGKAVAVPYCIEGTREMEFYRIHSLEELVPRTFGVLEPVALPENRITSFENSFCVLPGLAFDRFGYRLGYGGGYYDRFLSSAYRGVTAGLCYKACQVYRLLHGRFDVACRYIVSEEACRRAVPLRSRPSPKGKKTTSG